MVHEPPHGPSTRRKVIYICVFDGEGRNRTLPTEEDSEWEDSSEDEDTRNIITVDEFVHNL